MPSHDDFFTKPLEDKEKLSSYGINSCTPNDPAKNEGAEQTQLYVLVDAMVCTGRLSQLISSRSQHHAALVHRAGIKERAKITLSTCPNPPSG
jgi:hypothetical protein